MIRVLIVDDQIDYLRALGSALGRDFRVETATDLAGARETMSDRVQVALIDVRLSETDPDNRDGVHFLSWAKERYPDVPVVMMSAYTDFDAAVGALNLGADYFLKKPINLRELKELLRDFGSKGAMPDRTESLRSQLESGES